jgi:hypothetical protein
VGWRIAHGLALAAAIAAAGVVAAGTDGPAEPGAMAAAILSATFGAAAAAKLLRPGRWRRSLHSYRLPPAVEGVAVVVVPASELAVAALPFVGLSSTAGGLAIVLLTVFSGAIVAGRIRVGARLDCGCYGGTRARDYRVLLGRNALLAVAAAVAWRSAPDAPFGDSLGMPAGSQLLPAALVAGGLCLAAWLTVEAVAAVRRGSAR